VAFYSDRVLPHLLNLAMRHRELVPYRRRVASSAQGRVLEIGIGSGLNLPFYPASVDEVIGLDPSARLLGMATRQAETGTVPFTILQAGGDQIPLDSASIDTVVSTWTLCSIPNIALALAEVRRVLKPGGRFLFVEHGRAPDHDVARWQDRLTPLWKPIAGGCHLNRAMDALVSEAGFRIDDLRCGYMRGPRSFSFMYEGHAAALQPTTYDRIMNGDA
jgi:ubiquinone/menaquinone biosynthesis C-methylase UbiE